MDDPPDDTGQPPTNVLPSLLAPPSLASFVTVSDATTMYCSEDEINKKKSSQPPSLNDVPFLPHLSIKGSTQPSLATPDSTSPSAIKIEAFPSASCVLHPVSFGKILQSAKVKDIVNGSVKRIRRNYIALSFLTPTAANTFRCKPLLAVKGLSAFIPSFNITRLGLVRGVPSDWTPEGILGCIAVPEGCAQPRCFKCNNVHIDESCAVRDDEVSCLHCLGQHTTISKLCSELDRQKRIKISMAKDSIFYSETSKKHSSMCKSYANAAASFFSNPSTQ
ncbi:hypothetical protein EVAR_85075_1 [Eumeta japonica]|uniref:Nucleic-acid-binding protein from transposon X-element n=1 Tax=Eumeta variegata TaxID=151549 RepID=A0A4C1XEF6_EUMVA|nr:hypothetical protein EVAR_85075_1 [Eumeta japonica]